MTDNTKMRDFVDEVKQLCKDFSDLRDRPYMGDVVDAHSGRPMAPYQASAGACLQRLIFNQATSSQSSAAPTGAGNTKTRRTGNESETT